MFLRSLVPGKQEQSVTSKQVINRVLLQHRVYYYEFIRRASERCDPELQSLGKKAAPLGQGKEVLGWKPVFLQSSVGLHG